MASAYTDAWKPWDDRLGDQVLRVRNWQLIAGGLLLAVIALALDVSRLSTQVRYLFFAVEVDKLGVAIARAPLIAPVAGDPSAIITHMIRADVEMYIRDIRSVSSDPQVEQQAMNRMYAHTVPHSAADRFLDAYLHDATHNPFVIGQHRTVTVQIDSNLPVSSKTWQVRWTEEQRDAQGMAIGVPTHLEAQLQIAFTPPKDEGTYDPYLPGFAATNITWTQTNIGEQ